MNNALKFLTNTSIMITVVGNLLISKASAFSDIQNQFAKQCISQLAERNLVRGYADQTFRPQSTISRAEFAVLLLNAFPYGQQKQSGVNFKDVPTTHWAYKAIQAAYQQGFFTGYPDRTFRPSEPIPRVQAIAILGNHLFSIPENAETALKQHFDDVDQIPNYARNPVAAATSGRIVVNYPKVRQLQPNKSATRGEVAAIICQSLNLSRTVPIEYIAGGKEPFTIPPEIGGFTNFSEGLAGAEVNKKYGFINKNGELVIAAKFDEIRNFSSGLAAVKIGDKWGYIDKTGKLVIPVQYLQEPANFMEDVAKMILEDKIGFIDKTGNLLFTVAYPGAKSFVVNNFSDGLAAVRIDSEKTGFIDKTGKFIIEPQTYEISDFVAGMAAINVNGKYGYIDKTGKIVIPAQFEQAKPFSEGLAAVAVKEYNILKWGYIDSTGKIVIKPQFYYVQNFSEGLARISSDRDWGYIDKTGKVIIYANKLTVIPGSHISELESFSSGLALVRVGNKFGYIDKNGKWNIKPELPNAMNFQDGMARVNVAGKWLQNVGYDSSANAIIDYYFEGGKWGYIRSPLP
ncbi:WG repeat-containing protein [Calothrix sp. PCC 7507]|uniref:WG repeat-containing protein n=1 Tax=Calothrix sp. PCC 7507 TaxID=99598 RepID=UPI00029F4DC1|nr:WG repeat-containing protein [Calothrix sp. PCC 7507]AFY33466.1 S-layer domain-containing protein [Calothrix sp. PCC 7507]